MHKIFALLLFILPACTALDGSKEVSGTLRMGHEVRSFTDNADNKLPWNTSHCQRAEWIVSLPNKCITTKRNSFKPRQIYTS